MTTLEIDLKALAHNYKYLVSKLDTGVKKLAVVKAYAYGTDPITVSKKLEELGIDYLAVAYVSEGITLREGGITTPILVLHPQPENFDDLVKHCLEPSVYSYRVLNSFIAYAKEKQLQDYPIHLKFNTGLNRLGFKENNEHEILKILDTNTVKIQSLFSHLVASEDPNERDFTLHQIQTFKTIVKTLVSGLGYKPLSHQSNTSGVLNYPEARFDMVRIGIGLYGYVNDPKENKKLIPVATLKTKISQIHDISPGETVGYNRTYKSVTPQRTATLPLGHADGIARSYGQGKGFVVINGQKASIVGNVCMDMLMVNITHIDCKEGDEVLIFGQGARAEDLAKTIGSIAYELLTCVSQRVKRVIKR